MDEEGIIYIAFTVLILVVALTLTPEIGKGVFAILAIIAMLAGIGIIVMMGFADFVLIPAVFSLLHITIKPAEGYQIVKEQNAVVKNVNGLYYATGYVTANLFPYVFKLESSAPEEDTKLVTSPESWERAVANTGFPFKYHVLSMGLDVQKIRDELEGKRSYQEFQLSRALQSSGTNEVTITEIQRKINILQNEIDRISQGERPIATVMYVETTAIGVSEKAALDALTQQIRDLSISMSSMDVDLARVVGRELYLLFNFNFALPATPEEMNIHFDLQS